METRSKNIKLWVDNEPAGIETLDNILGPSEISGIKDHLVSPKVISAFFMRKGGGKGALVLRQNEYDSSFFGMRVGNVLYSGDELSGEYYEEPLKYIISRAKEESYGYIYFNIPGKLSFVERPAIEAGFERCTSSVDLFIELGGRVFLEGHEEIRIAGSKDENAIADIASTAFRRSRLYDAGIASTQEVDEYHARWIVNLMNSGQDKVFVVDRGGEPAGFLAIRISPDEKNGRIILLAIDKNHRRLGLGRELLEGVLRWSSGKLHGIYVKTQANNVPAIELYEKIGFEIVERENGYHLVLEA